MVDELNAPETGTTETQVETKTETVEELKARLEEAERRAANKAAEAERHFKKLAKFEQAGVRVGLIDMPVVKGTEHSRSTALNAQFCSATGDPRLAPAP